MSKSLFIFAGGGTGGHLFPALAVVEALRIDDNTIDVAFYCTDKQIDRDILNTAHIRAVPLMVQPFPTRPWRWPAFWLRWRQSVHFCRRQFAQHRPTAVIGAGGYASGPPVHAAMQMGIPTFLLNPDAVPGRANQHFARKKAITGIFAQWEVTRRHLPPSAPVLITGCPVRSTFTQHSALGAQHFGLDPQRRTLLVTGASQGARTINDAMIRLAPEITITGWQVLHLSGQADCDRVTKAYQAAGTPHVVVPFTDQMADAMSAADLVISRAGASSLAEILAVGKPSILYPYPYHRDMHQRHNGAVLVEAGAAVMLEDQKNAARNAQELKPILMQLMTDDARRESMVASARKLGQPNAATIIANVLHRLIEPSANSTVRLSSPSPGHVQMHTAS